MARSGGLIRFESRRGVRNYPVASAPGRPIPATPRAPKGRRQPTSDQRLPSPLRGFWGLGMGAFPGAHAPGYMPGLLRSPSGRLSNEARFLLEVLGGQPEGIHAI